MDGSALLSWLRAQPDANAVEVVAKLLAVCHASLAELRARWSDRRYHRGTRTTISDVERIIGATRSLRLRRSSVEAIASRFDAAIAEIGVALAAHAVASGIDAALGPDFGGYFDGVEDRVLAVGDPFPIHAAPTMEIVGKRDSPGRPENLTPPLVRTAHLGIVTFDNGITIELRALGRRLRPPHKGSKVALISTNGDLTEFSADVYDEAKRPLGPDADWTSGRGYFYNVRPGRFGADAETLHAAHEEQRRRIARGLSAAADAGCDVVVLPEFCSTDAIHAWLLTLDAVARIPMLITGSRHIATPSGRGPGTNEAVVLLRGHQVGTAAKFADFNIKLPPPFPAVPLYEDLARAPRVTLLSGAGSSVVLLICKDAMNTDVIDVVRMLSPTFLIVPTMSPELDRLVAVAQELAHYPQVVTVAANIGPVTALVGRPFRTIPVVTASCDPGSALEVALADGLHRVL